MFFNLAADNVPALLDDLGLSAAALEGELSQKIISDAYKKCMKKYHPDVAKLDVIDAEKKFLSAQKAYEVLTRRVKDGDTEIGDALASAKSFLKTFGQEEEAERAGDSRSVISFEMAMKSLQEEGGEYAIGRIDSLLARKMLFWARGFEQNNNNILTSAGYFTQKSVVNIIEYAELMMSNHSRRSNFFQDISFNSSNEEEREIGQKIYDWIEENYTLLKSGKWMAKDHLTNYKKSLSKVAASVCEGLDTNIEGLGTIKDLVSSGSTSKALEHVARSQVRLKSQIASFPKNSQINKEVQTLRDSGFSDEDFENPETSKNPLVSVFKNRLLEIKQIKGQQDRIKSVRKQLNILNKLSKLLKDHE